MNQTSGQTSEIDRRAAWTSAKLAVRSYAREPSDSNADRVESALRQVRNVTARLGRGQSRDDHTGLNKLR